MPGKILLRTVLAAIGIFVAVALDAQPNAPDFSQVPGVVVDHSPAATERYIGSPSLAKLPTGDYVAVHDSFGPKSNEGKVPTSVILRSKDRGMEWTKVTEIQGAFWSTLFPHRGKLYLLGMNRNMGHPVIRRSDDAGTTWTSPVDAKSGLLRADGRYHGAPTPVLEHNGRLWRAMEMFLGAQDTRPRFGAGMLSVAADADLLDASQWTFSNFVPSSPTWNGGDLDSWREGNAVAAPDGAMAIVIRTQTKSVDERAAILRVSVDGRHVSFSPEKDLVPFPGGGKKFTIRFDPTSRLYWSVASIVPEWHRNTTNPAGIRNTLALISSRNLETWTVSTILLFHRDANHHGFHYVDWLFDGNDIIAVSRTAYDDGLGGAHSKHDTNFMTFHRWTNFRRLTMADAAPEYLKRADEHAKALRK